MSDYNALQRILHYVALANTSILEATLDAELAFCKSRLTDQSLQKHVFVSGLARGGTTILMRSLYESRQFASLTYGDMPFVLAPNLWLKISAKSRKQIAAKERAHGDGILVDFNSPEALDEVFWRTFSRKQYIHKKYIVPHDCDDEIIDTYRKYIAAILIRYTNNRYLSKNNNNILRFSSIFRALPNAMVLVPFRDPVQHANSLLTQHVLFNKKQSEDNFTRRYMSWLGHYEFGLSHKPFKVGESRDTYFDTATIEYWLQQWRNVYQFLLKENDAYPENTLCISYELFCSETKALWQALCRILDIDKDHPPVMTEKVRETPAVADKELLADVQGIYEELTRRCRRALIQGEVVEKSAHNVKSV